MQQKKQLTEGSSILLDLIRAISVQLVVIGHGISFCSIATFMHPPNFPWIQNIAVLIFFILSGYLISNSIFTKLAIDKNYSYKAYFIDRFSRIYSAFIPALFFILVIDYISIQASASNYNYSEAFDLKTFFGNIFMLQDFPFLKHLHVKITSFGSGRPLWTLAIEWWIYLWFGVLTIKLLKKEKPSAFTIISFILLSIVPAYNLVNGRGNGLTLFWIFGVLIGLVYDYYKAIQMKKLLKFGFLIIILVLAGMRVMSTIEEYDPLFAFLLAIALLIGMELSSTMSVNKNIGKAIRLIANYSYTLYLIHFSIYDLMVNHFQNTFNAYQLFFIGFLISNIISLGLGYLTETKLTKAVKNKLRKKFL